LIILKPKTKVEQCWHFVPCITIKENEDIYVLIRYPMHQHQREWGHISIQHKTNSARCKTQVGDLKDGVVLIPFTKCLWDDTCLPNCRFSTKPIHSANVCDPLLLIGLIFSSEWVPFNDLLLCSIESLLNAPSYLHYL
jgi:hypothetical protein